ncbi:TetR/AcrR family transcriptional regulator [Saccharopolyspora rhizosphaerae]|uniref:TetR/AcrR family transcriptional regulator n=1 Tax=Saccharopolyspora rhizosphaerae TaxID=2492662 RepID=A0A426JYF5_9PSEU|nr:TetR/AcrR family transcriptional regulator [Saccharopolyspora rhizosphaerae]RRO18220.1 TetR/AcrR family transcriptional regulator [Saccharopolyspora rhizosphaerae]
MPRPRIHDEKLRNRLLDEAGRLLAAEGPASLSLRRVAADAGTSTSAVYTLFGGKSELIRAVFLEAALRFGEVLATVERSDDPVEDLLRLGVAYREFAVAHPNLYAVLFSRPLPEFEPDEEAKRESLGNFTPLAEMVRAAIDAGRIDGEPEAVAMGLWAIVHGLVTLELHRNLPEGLDPASQYEEVLRRTLRGWLA